MVSSTESDIKYTCSNCSTVIAELPYRVRLSDVFDNHDGLSELEEDIIAVSCPNCETFHEIPNRDDEPEQLNVSVNLSHLLAETEQTGIMSGFDPEGHSIDPETHILNRWDNIYELSHKNLRQLSKYLSDAILRTSPPRISYDHFVYWGWTAAYITEHPISESDPFEDLVSEYLSLVHIMLFKLRHIYSRIFYAPGGLHANIDGREITWEEAFRTIEWGNPSIQHLTVLPDRYAASTGFAVLEGLINIHSSHISTETGHLISEVSSPWHPHQSSLKGEHTYHDKLQSWRYHAASPETKSALSLIDDLSRYETDVLRANMAGIEDILKEEQNTTNHFLRVIAKQRNLNLHGQLPTRVIGTLITTLCSLVIWDIVPDSDFEQHRESVLEKVKNQENEAYEDVMSAPAFMPVDRVQHLTGINTVTPSDSQFPEWFDRFGYGDTE